MAGIKTPAFLFAKFSSPIMQIKNFYIRFQRRKFNMVGCLVFFSWMLITMILALLISCALMIFIATIPSVTRWLVRWSLKITKEMSKMIEAEMKDELKD